MQGVFYAGVGVTYVEGRVTEAALEKALEDVEDDAGTFWGMRGVSWVGVIGLGCVIGSGLRRVMDAGYVAAEG